MNLDTIVRDVLLEHNYTLHRYAYFAAFAQRAHRELLLDMLYRRVPLVIDLTNSGEGIERRDDHTYQLPVDYVDLVRIGRSIDGLFITMTEDRRVARMVAAPPVPEMHALFYHTDPSQDVGEYAVVGKTLYLHPAISSLYNVELEYTSTGGAIPMTQEIHPYLAPTITAYVKWKAKLADPSEYYNQVRTLKARLSKTNTHDVARSTMNRRIR